MRSLMTIFRGIPYLFYTVLTLNKVKKLDPEKVGRARYNEEVHQIPKHFARKIFRWSGSKINVHGEDKIPDQPFLIVANHQANYDIFTLLGYFPRPFGFISKIEVKKLPIVRTWMETMDCLFLDRKNRRQSLQTFKQGIELLKGGHNLMIFQEGTRSLDGKMLPFKSGSFTLAKKAGVPVVPVMIDGTYKIMEMNGNRIKPAKVNMTVCDPIFPEDYQELTLDEMASITRERIQKAMDEVKED
ncbi:1-acyl-sn-glycerol-3-phosphate acyltransferase [Halalkalibacillus sediminis]|uniref:1-acyl-sn-glycerol-3-phosphate acyltransferase n=1 Tax=Halalkalibacillus sediminis TaxID=2018042 RepID=A0A2I0QRF4_9BACI|nr:lysophospholipid acyltransferase family protein [Halalkalibacillus sediminis]PKR76925.1 1-acyl-sn-glycerol-3-phosphate acyltransferase [Halalkalibacillus sediminis]